MSGELIQLNVMHGIIGDDRPHQRGGGFQKWHRRQSFRTGNGGNGRGAAFGLATAVAGNLASRIRGVVKINSHAARRICFEKRFNGARVNGEHDIKS